MDLNTLKDNRDSIRGQLLETQAKRESLEKDLENNRHLTSKLEGAIDVLTQQINLLTQREQEDQQRKQAALEEATRLRKKQEAKEKAEAEARAAEAEAKAQREETANDVAGSLLEAIKEDDVENGNNGAAAVDSLYDLNATEGQQQQQQQPKTASGGGTSHSRRRSSAKKQQQQQPSNPVTAYSSTGMPPMPMPMPVH